MSDVETMVERIAALELENAQLRTWAGRCKKAFTDNRQAHYVMNECAAALRRSAPHEKRALALIHDWNGGLPQRIFTANDVVRALKAKP